MSFLWETSPVYLSRITLLRTASRGGGKRKATYVAIGSIPGIRIDLKGLMASFSSSTAYVLLPDSITYDILHGLDFDTDINSLPLYVTCEQRAMLPEITFNPAGSNFSLTSYDYTFEWPIEGYGTRCVNVIMPIGLSPQDTTEIMLGSAFVRAFYSIFDLDRPMLGCMSSSTRNFQRSHVCQLETIAKLFT